VSDSTDRRDFIRRLTIVTLEELWRSRREGVRERLWLTGIIFSGGTSAGFLSLAKVSPAVITYPLISFLMVLSVWAILFTLKVDYMAGAREWTTERALELYGLGDISLRASKYPRPWVRGIRIGMLFPILFLLSFCFLLFVLLELRLGNGRELLVVFPPVVLFLGAACFFWNLKYWWPPEDERKRRRARRWQIIGLIFCLIAIIEPFIFSAIG